MEKSVLFGFGIVLCRRWSRLRRRTPEGTAAARPYAAGRLGGIVSFCIVLLGCSHPAIAQNMKSLTPEERRVILQKGTERPFSGAYYDCWEDGTYLCRQCGAPLYRSQDKFDAGCGWPSFDDAVAGAVERVPDADGRRTEIVCARCGGHLGHVFAGEGFTPKNTRHCVNSVSMVFEPAADEAASPERRPEAAVRPAVETAYFAGGCFWGVEHMLRQLDGVVDVESGYMGGSTPSPTYEQVSRGRTGHAETVRVRFDPSRVSYETLARLFFEIHDPTQENGQGPDIGDQYRSEIFYTSPEQRAVAYRLISLLRAKGYEVVTEVAPAGRFWPAEAYHQDYYLRKGTRPYCHGYTRRF